MKKGRGVPNEVRKEVGLQELCVNQFWDTRMDACIHGSEFADYPFPQFFIMLHLFHLPTL